MAYFKLGRYFLKQNEFIVLPQTRCDLFCFISLSLGAVSNNLNISSISSRVVTFH